MVRMLSAVTAAVTGVPACLWLFLQLRWWPFMIENVTVAEDTVATTNGIMKALHCPWLMQMRRMPWFKSLLPALLQEVVLQRFVVLFASATVSYAIEVRIEVSSIDSSTITAAQLSPHLSDTSAAPTILTLVAQVSWRSTRRGALRRQWGDYGRIWNYRSGDGGSVDVQARHGSADDTRAPPPSHQPPHPRPDHRPSCLQL